MRKLLVPALFLGLALPLGAADKNAAKYKPTQDDYDALIKIHKVLGKISKVEGTSQGFTFIFESTVPDQAKINHANQGPLRTLRSRKPSAAAVANAQNQILINNQKYVKHIRKDFQLQATSKTKVRVRKLPVQYDEKGNVKEYTKKEKEELKGKDKTLPGYEATWDNIAEGQIVKVSVRAPKKKKKESSKDAEAAKADTKAAEEDDESLTDAKAIVTVIVIEKEPEEKKTKKKKN